jgi:hypothetical protein
LPSIILSNPAVRLHSRDGHAPLRRRFAAEKWVKPEVDPPRVLRCRAGSVAAVYDCRIGASPPALIETPLQAARCRAVFLLDLSF